MSEKMTLERLHLLFRLGQVDSQGVGAYWDEIAPSLLVAPPGNDVQTLVQWAGEHQRRAQMISDLFSTNPAMVFENDRLGLVLLLGSDETFRSNLLRYYLVDTHPEISQVITCRTYAENPGDSLLGESWQGSILTQFAYLKTNPFHDTFCLSKSMVDAMDRDEVLSFVSVLTASVTDSCSLSINDRVNLGILLSSQVLMGQSSLIVQQCRVFWDSVVSVGILQDEAALSSMGATLRGVISDTSSFDLYQVVTRNHDDIASRFPVHLELIILNDVAQGHYRIRPDDNPDFPTFTLERVVGKAITTKKTQAWLLDWLDKKGGGQDGIDCLDEKIVFDDVRPLLDKHRDALVSKASLLNPEEFSSGEILQDIRAGRYFRVACRALLNESYGKALTGLPLDKILQSESYHSEFFVPMFGLYFQNSSEKAITAAYSECRKIKPRLDFLCELFRERFKASPPGFLLKACKGRDEVVDLLKELEARKIPMPAGLIFQNKDLDPAMRDEFFSRDMGL